ncbi:hypothetical protein SAMN04515666_108164 [Bosea lupini]|uniref:Uncharacterized protein n=1 Tax=Bosea lupini TaxID=1036779 RepID=A0A1H7WGE7_9HYPH|nr:hypothetical protein [Bosea lupini]SEM20583.1 hypothetical protein SAMN04515666_108164 [Bosea lupini]
MRPQPKSSPVSNAVAITGPSGRRELYRELCQDEDGNSYTVLIYRTFPDLQITHYTLEDGTPVRLIDDCLFEIESTGRTLNRCEL